MAKSQFNKASMSQLFSNVYRYIASIAAAAVVCTAGPAVAQDYPTKPIRFVVAQGAGGVGDLIARVIGQKMTASLGQQVIIDNRVGANGILGVDAVAKAPPDGYTVLLGSSANLAINPALYKKLPYDPVKDLAPVAMIGKLYYAVLVPASSPANTIQEFVALARAHPHKLNYGSGGSAARASIEIFMALAKIDLNHIPYKSNSQTLIDLVGGRLDLIFESTTTAAQHIRSGQVKALAVTSGERMAQYLALPTVAESGFPGYELSGWVSMVTPAGVPAAIRQKLATAIGEIVTRQDVAEEFRTLGLEARYAGPEQLAALLRTDMARYKKAVTDAGIPLE